MAFVTKITSGTQECISTGKFLWTVGKNARISLSDDAETITLEIKIVLGQEPANLNFNPIDSATALLTVSGLLSPFAVEFGPIRIGEIGNKELDIFFSIRAFGDNCSIEYSFWVGGA